MRSVEELEVRIGQRQRLARNGMHAFAGMELWR
jgi:hypothetical protein